MARKTRPTTVAEVAAALDQLAPPELAQSWDNVGLLVGDRAADCQQVLLCIDFTPPVLDEAARAKCEFVVAYHPPLFQPVRRLLADSPDTDALVHRAIAGGMAIYSPHTALDAAPGGTNDVLAGLCGATELEPFEYVATGAAQVKLVTFVPAEQVDALAGAMAAAGAGRIGEYEQCSFRLAGTGTFYGLEATSPRVGRKGRLEQVPEIRIEMVAPAGRVPSVVAALRKAHPYEEPAFDIYPLSLEPVAGIGRVGRLPAGTTLSKLVTRLKRATGSKVIMTVGEGRKQLRQAAICVGAAGRLPFEKARARDGDVIITGEIRHHEALTILRRGKTAIALGHWESERPALAALARRLKEKLPALRVWVSRADAGPFERA
jgi:dinuclear metal center YbgI/SA1388 family protein